MMDERCNQLSKITNHNRDAVENNHRNSAMKKIYEKVLWGSRFTEQLSLEILLVRCWKANH
jgi:hypothetical protein